VTFITYKKSDYNFALVDVLRILLNITSGFET